MKSFILLSVASLALTGSGMAAISMTAVGVYDDTTNTNVVDNSATTLTVGTFTSDVATAFAAGKGGVITFDGATGTSGDWTVAYGAASMNVGVTSNFNSPLINMGNVSTIQATPISGSVYFRLAGSGTNRATSTFTFAQPLSEFGFTFLARSVAVSTLYVTGTYSDGSTFTLFDAGSSLTIAANTVTSAPDYLNSPTSGSDRFVGLTATAGKAISTITISQPTNSFGVIDDFGFIVSPIPEPTAGLLAAGGLAGLLLRRRRN